MTTQEPPPMSSALRALIDKDNQRPGPSTGDRTRVYAALGVSLGVLPAGALMAAHAAGASAAAAATVAPGGTTAVATAVGAASTVGRFALLVKAPLVSVGVGAVLGAALTAYVAKGPAGRWTASARSHRAAAVATAAARVSPSIAPPAASPAEEPGPATALAAPVAPPPTAATMAKGASPRHASALAAGPDKIAGRAGVDAPTSPVVPVTDATLGGSLAAEQALLDPARAALAHGDGAKALARLGLHEQRFPGGALSQEREAMAIKALVLTGDRDRARARATSFGARYPGSLLWPMIVATLDAKRDTTSGSNP